MTVLSHRLIRTAVLPATPETLFAYFSESPRWASWWGPGSSIEPHPGGRMTIRHANGVEVAGDVLDVSVPARITFTYGYVSGAPIAVGASQVRVDVEPHALGASLRLTHDFADRDARDQHEQGWRFQLSLLANAVAGERAPSAGDIADRWFAAWSEPDAGERDRSLEALVASKVRFEDRFSRIAGLDELRAHLGAVHRFMPGMRLQRHGPARYCQWHILADWTATASDGTERGSGTNLFVLDADGRIAAVTGFWV